MDIDRSEGWDSVAAQFLASRSDIGAGLVRSWARENLAPSATIVDVGCGSGVPIAQALFESGFSVFGIDASPALLSAFRRRFPGAPTACEAAQDSGFFHRSFDAAISVGLLFLLSGEDQAKLLRRVAEALKPGGRFLFSAPRQTCEWQDMLTGRRSLSLGQDEYEHLLGVSGLRLTSCRVDDGANNYFDAEKPAG